VSRLSSSACRMGSANAAVFPEPVCASAMRSLPAQIQASPRLRTRGAAGGRRTAGVTLEGVGDGLSLDSGRLLPLHGVAGLQQLRAEPQLRERGGQARRRILRLVAPRDHLFPARHGRELGVRASREGQANGGAAMKRRGSRKP
jgi:hypothetical protein